jgi:drug/metabolite transporter (DMT)-like permease
MIAPLLIVALAAVLLKEQVDTGRWLAIAVGMLGVWTILRPDTAGFVFWASLAAFVSALCYALSALIARRLTNTDSSESLMFSFLGIMALVCLVAALPNWRAIATADWGWILGIGATGAVAQYLLTEAFRYAGAAVLAPMEYTALLWGLALDWAIWSALPSPIVYLGAALVVGAGLYVMQRERRVAAIQS